VKVKGLEVAIKADRQTFARILIIQRHRSIDLKDMLCYELSSLPLSIANQDGTLSKTAKVKLIQSIESKIPTTSICPANTPAIFDGMVLLQKLPKILLTFGDISDYLLKKIQQGTSRVTYFGTDHYRSNSVKSMEREKRSSIGTLKVISKKC